MWQQKFGLILLAALGTTTLRPPSPVGALAETAAQRGRNSSLCGRLQYELALPRGNATYLPPYRDLLRRCELLFSGAGRPKDAKAGLKVILKHPRAAADLRAILASISIKGVRPDLLRDQIVRQTGLHGRASARYGKFWNRLGVALTFHFLSRDYERSGHHRQSAASAKTAIFLLAQDEISGSAYLWSNLGKSWYAATGVQGLAARMRRLNRRLLQGYAARQNALSKLDHDANRLLRRQAAGKPHASKMVARLRRLLVLDSGHLHSEFMLAQNIYYYRGRFNSLGLRGVSNMLGANLADWATLVHKHKFRRKVDRQALLRWIKEAMGP